MIRRGWAFLLPPLTALLVTLPAGPAAAHANLSSSDPLSGATLDRAPDAVRLTFTEEPDPSLSVIQVLDVEGSEVQQGSPTTDSADELTLRVPIDDLAKGVYSVSWRVVSRVDGHATAGVFAFGIGVNPLDAPLPKAPTVSTPSVSPLEVVGRWGLIVGLIALLGAATTSLVALGEPPRSVRVLMTAALLLSVLGLAALAEALRQAADVGFGRFIDTTVGRSILWRGAGILAAGAGVPWALASTAERRRVALLVVALGSAGAMYAEVAAGHAAAAATRPWAEVAAQWAHFAAAGVWMGGLVTLLLGIRGAPGEQKTRAVRRFSAAAFLALPLVAITGVIRAVNEVGSIGKLFSTSYGQVVVAKVGLLGILFGLGAINRYRNVPRVGKTLKGLRRVSRAEISLAGVVLVAASLLTALAPPSPRSGALAAQPGTLLAVSGSDFASTVRVRLEASPGLPGTNRFVARVTDFDSGDAIEADRVALRFAFLDEAGVGGSTLELERQEDGTYTGAGPNLSLGGHWEVVVLIQRGADAVEVPLVLATSCDAEVLGPNQNPTIYAIPLSGGRSIQALVGGLGDGRYEVHFTFYRKDGDEIPIEEEAEIAASRPGTEPEELPVGRLGPGHFVGRTTLDPGSWRFQVTASADPDGGEVRGCFKEQIQG
jgi:copper transport protein